MKSFIIRLKHNNISEEQAQDCVEQARKFNIDVEYFDAVNGLEHQTHCEKLNIRPLKFFKKGLPGVYGCLLSHYYLWSKCVELNEPIIILEHDGYFIRPLPDDILDRFQDVLKLDSLNPYDPEYSKIIQDSFHDDCDLEVTEINHNEKLHNDAGFYSWGSYAYIIKPHAAKNVIDWIADRGFLPSDHQLGTRVARIETCWPTMARLHPFYAVDDNIHAMSLTRNTKFLSNQQ
jgi:GR25 family glycosyltransferase involved in LPS biosynthesis